MKFSLVSAQSRKNFDLVGVIKLENRVISKKSDYLVHVWFSFSDNLNNSYKKSDNSGGSDKKY